MRVLFMGSPDFALPSLQILAQHHELVAVVTQPDRRAGRGRKLTASPVKRAALQLGTHFLQPPRIKDPSISAQLGEYNPDVIVVVAYGQILPPEILKLPRHGCVNVHASLLPRWRGGAPIPAAILHGDETSGVTIMKIDPGLDTGPVISQRQTALLVDETGATLTSRLAIMGAELLHDTLSPYCSGELVPTPQDETLATYASSLKKSDGLLDWRKPAIDLERQIRAYEPWPGTYFQWGQRRLLVCKAHAVPDHSADPGSVVMSGGLPAVGTSTGVLVLETIQPAGRKAMPANVFLHGSPEFLKASLPLPG